MKKYIPIPNETTQEEIRAARKSLLNALAIAKSTRKKRDIHNSLHFYSRRDVAISNLNVASDMSNDLATRRNAFLGWMQHYFCKENRGTTGTVCNYIEGCAIGFHVDESVALALDACGTAWEDVINAVIDDSEFRTENENAIVNAYEDISDWLKSLDGNIYDLNHVSDDDVFLGACQSLHDSVSNWDSKGLTRQGLEELNEIKTNFDLWKVEDSIPRS